MRQIKKMTIAEAWDYVKKQRGEDYLEIAYIWVDYCERCGISIYTYDEEFSFAGSREEFEEYCKNYDHYEADDEIELIDDIGPEFRLYRDNDGHSECALCLLCEDGNSNIINIKNTEKVNKP